MKREEAKSIIEAMVAMREAVTDEQALAAPAVYPKWKAGKDYAEGERVLHGGALYKVLQGHVSQEGWEPTAAPSLFAKVLIPDQNVIPEWEQPGSTNPYMTGDRVLHDGQAWESLVDNNVWEPTVENATLWAAVEAE